MRNENLAWAAGVFDGEGCISIGCVKPTAVNKLQNQSYRLTVKVTMGCERTVRRVAELMGTGSVQRHMVSGGKFNASWSWVAMARKAEAALRLMQPWLITKEAECLIALKFMALPDVKRGGKGGSPKMSAALLKKKHALYEACARAKPRFRFRKTALREPQL